MQMDWSIQKKISPTKIDRVIAVAADVVAVAVVVGCCSKVVRRCRMSSES